MSIYNKIKSTEILMGKTGHGDDLLEEITDICRKNSITLGRVEAIGSVQKARLAYYNQQTREYQFFTIDAPLEIINFSGNISLKDGEPTVHAHISLADKTGQTYGGHLAPGTVVFACEFIIEVFTGQVFERKLDKLTGLPLWEMRK